MSLSERVNSIKVDLKNINQPSLNKQSGESGAFNGHSFNGHSMTGDLRRVIVCPPANAGWNVTEKSATFRELGFRHAPHFAGAQKQHQALCRVLQENGAEVLTLPGAESSTLDAVYAHDASLATDFGILLMNPGKKSRRPEAAQHAEFCAGVGVPVFGSVVGPGISEAGDIVWLDAKTLLIGNGYRTNQDGIKQIRQMLSPYTVEVLSAPLPHGTGPSACLHLMSLMSMLDEQTILVDLPWLAVETVNLLQARNFRLIEIDESERETLACNVLALGKKRLVALQENAKTNQRLSDSGFDVKTFPGDELCINGGGGPTCLTRPLLRG